MNNAVQDAQLEARTAEGEARVAETEAKRQEGIARVPMTTQHDKAKRWPRFSLRMLMTLALVGPAMIGSLALEIEAQLFWLPAGPRWARDERIYGMWMATACLCLIAMVLNLLAKRWKR